MSGMRQSAAVSTGPGINAAICDLQARCPVPGAKPSAASCRTQAQGGNIHAIHTFCSVSVWSCCPCLLTASYQSMTLPGIHLLQCYLFTAVAADHEAAELAPGAGPEDHEAAEAGHAAAH